MFFRCQSLLRPSIVQTIHTNSYTRIPAGYPRFHLSQRVATMSSSSTTIPPVATAATAAPAPQDQPPSSLALPEPPAEDGHIKLDMSTGNAEAKLDNLGPLVVHEDGTVSRINNWGEMSEIERQNTLRILGKRNKMRLAKLRGEKAA